MKQVMLLVAVMTLALLGLAACTSNTPVSDGTDTDAATETGAETVTATATETEPESESATETESETESGPVVVNPIPVTLTFDQTDLCGLEGESLTKSNWCATDYVDVSGLYGLRYLLAARKDAYAVSFYDAERRFISGAGQGCGRDANSILTTGGYVVCPEGAVYARFMNYNGARDPMNDAAVTGYATAAEYNAAMTAHPLGGKKIVCLGDSLTEGDYGKQVGVANVFYRNYPFFLVQKTGATTVNYGVCGATSVTYYQDMYRRKQVDVTDADVVILMLGTNLGLRDGYAVTYERLVRDVRKDLKEGAILILVTPPHATENPEKPNYGYNGNVVSAVEFVREYAAEQGLPLIDAYADSPIQPENEDVYQAHDGLHMCEAGYEVFATFMEEEILRVMGYTDAP